TAPPTPETYSLSLPDALPISVGVLDADLLDARVAARLELHAGAALGVRARARLARPGAVAHGSARAGAARSAAAVGTTLLAGARSEEHTSELQSLTNLVCRLL